MLDLCLVLVSVVEGDVEEPRVHPLHGVGGIPDVDLVAATCKNMVQSLRLVSGF